jgi:hypothetical protein
MGLDRGHLFSQLLCATGEVGKGRVGLGTGVVGMRGGFFLGRGPGAEPIGPHDECAHGTPCGLAPGTCVVGRSWGGQAAPGQSPTHARALGAAGSALGAALAWRGERAQAVGQTRAGRLGKRAQERRVGQAGPRGCAWEWAGVRRWAAGVRWAARGCGCQGRAHRWLGCGWVERDKGAGEGRGLLGRPGKGRG